MRKKITQEDIDFIKRNANKSNEELANLLGRTKGQIKQIKHKHNIYKRWENDLSSLKYNTK